jgi:hypothetical protein
MLCIDNCMHQTKSLIIVFATLTWRWIGEVLTLVDNRAD